MRAEEHLRKFGIDFYPWPIEPRTRFSDGFPRPAATAQVACQLHVITSHSDLANAANASFGLTDDGPYSPQALPFWLKSMLINLEVARATAGMRFSAFLPPTGALRRRVPNWHKVAILRHIVRQQKRTPKLRCARIAWLECVLARTWAPAFHPAVR